LIGKCSRYPSAFRRGRNRREIGQDWATLAKRARITGQKATDYLPSECLVHLIRDAIRHGDQRVATVLMSPLLVRCESILLRRGLLEV